MRAIQTAFEDYIAHTYDGPVIDEQHHQLRMAFFAGVHLLKSIFQNMDEDDALGNEEIVASICSEMNAFRAAARAHAE